MHGRDQGFLGGQGWRMHAGSGAGAFKRAGRGSTRDQASSLFQEVMPEILESRRSAHKPRAGLLTEVDRPSRFLDGGVLSSEARKSRVVRTAALAGPVNP